MTEELPTVVEALELRREMYGWSKGEMAQKLGLHPSHYSDILSGKRRLPLPATKKAYKIGVPAKVLLQESTND